ncbi:MAG TPA: hypothetical protein VEU96_29230 [Bryobacteraceae bacterium]|nr:hypothetical protein [Bryobacteraceae bacterium]
MHLALSVILGSALLMVGASGQAVDSAKPQGQDHRTPAVKADAHRVSPSIFEDGPPPAQAKPVKQPVEGDPVKVDPVKAVPSSPVEPVVNQPQWPTVERVDTPPLPLKDVKPGDFASVKVGFTEKEMIAVLGPPASRVVVPDDDGHLRESCQYWGDGKLLGVVRLNDGRVATVEVRNK